jgi:hypothetical protein
LHWTKTVLYQRLGYIEIRTIRNTVQDRFCKYLLVAKIKNMTPRAFSVLSFILFLMYDCIVNIVFLDGGQLSKDLQIFYLENR